GSGPLSINISEQEYSRFLERDGFRFSSATEARSNGQFRELATQSGVFGSFAYSLDLDWQSDQVQPYQGSLDRWEGYAQAKKQFGLQDTAVVLTRWADFSSGDNFQRFDPYLRPALTIHETQLPIAVGMWRHDWSADNQTLLL